MPGTTQAETPVYFRKMVLFGVDTSLVFLGSPPRAYAVIQPLLEAFGTETYMIARQLSESRIMAGQWRQVAMPGNPDPQTVMAIEYLPLLLVGTGLVSSCQPQPNSVLMRLAETAAGVLAEDWHLGDGREMEARRSTAIAQIAEANPEAGGNFDLLVLLHQGYSREDVIPD